MRQKALAWLLIVVLLFPGSMSVASTSDGQGLLLPRLGTPIFSTAGGEVTIELVSASSLQSINLVRGGQTVPMSVVEVRTEDGKTVIRARIPQDATEAMYDLEIRMSDGTTIAEPHCVVVWQPKSEIEVVVTSDVHYSLRSTVEIQALRAIIESMNALKPDLLIMTGDQVDYSRDESHHAAFRRELMNLEVPVVLIPGNNDEPDNSVALFEKFQAAHSGVVRMGWVDFFVVDGDTGYVSEEELDLLASRARISDAVLKVALCHYAVWSLSDEGNRRDYLDVLKDTGISIALSGHIHTNADQTVEGVRQIVTVSASEPAPGQAGELRVMVLSRGAGGISDMYMIPLGTPVDPIIPNLGSVPAGWANFSNPFPRAMSFTYKFRVRSDGATPTVEGGELLSTAVENGTLIVRVNVTLGPRGSREVKVYFQMDVSPPQIETIGTSPAEPKLGDAVTIRMSMVETGWGLKALDVRATYPNGTTKYARSTIIGDELRIELVGDRSVRETTVKIEATDWADQTSSKQVRITYRVELLSPEGIVEILSSYGVLVLALVVAAGAAAYVLRRGKK